MRHSDRFPPESSAGGARSGSPHSGDSGPQERPGDAWICGHFDTGLPCSHGPSADGRCPVRGPCQPAARAGAAAGEPLRCMRPVCSGGPCPMGPEPDGTCGMTPTPCRPRRSWHQRRRLAVQFAALSSGAVLVLAILGPWRREVFAPGPLSGPHAQILATSQFAADGSPAANDRCAACHTAARGGLAAWFSSGGAGHQGVSQTELCIECHHATIRPERARAAHNLTGAELQRIRAAANSPASQFSQISASLSPVGLRENTWHDALPRPSFSNDRVECAACHREHGGKDADLTWMSSSQCQTCHQDRFASFADGHPDWHDWPYNREPSKRASVDGGGSIAFNHATHQHNHFAQKATAFDCRGCHTVTTAGEIARTGTFEATCAACHDQPLRVTTGEGIDLVALPMLDLDAVRQAGIAAPPWPEQANGVDAIAIAPLTRMLLADDPAVVAAIRTLTDPTANLWQGPPSPTRLRAMATVAEAIHALIESLAGDAGGEFGSLGIFGQLSPQLIATARDRWFETPEAKPDEAAPQDDRPLTPTDAKPADSLADDALLGDALLGGALLGDAPLGDALLADPRGSDPLFADPLATDPLAADFGTGAGEGEAEPPTTSSERFDAARLLPAGGWYRDDLRMAIRYRAAGHADPVLRAIVELASDAALATADRQSLLKLPAVAACVECHPAVRRGEAASWCGGRDTADRRTFTRFAHKPHLHLPALADCTHCHTVGELREEKTPLGIALTTASFDSSASHAADAPHDFEPLLRATCAACHTPQAAGDNCTQCHRYHVDP